MISHRPKFRQRKRSRGQAVVEFVIVLPVLLLLMFGAIDFGRLFFAHISNVNAAREGAAYAAAHASDGTYDPITFSANTAQAATAQSNSCY